MKVENFHFERRLVMKWFLRTPFKKQFIFSDLTEQFFNGEKGTKNEIISPEINKS
jgi:hypothetical protein